MYQIQLLEQLKKELARVRFSYLPSTSLKLLGKNESAITFRTYEITQETDYDDELAQRNATNEMGKIGYRVSVYYPQEEDTESTIFSDFTDLKRQLSSIMEISTETYQVKGRILDWDIAVIENEISEQSILVAEITFTFVGAISFLSSLAYVLLNNSGIGKDYNYMQSVVLANHAGLAPVADMTIAFRTLVTSLPTTSTKMIDCGVGADDLFASWQVSLNPAGTLTLGGISGSTYVSVTSTLTIPAGSETAVIIKKNGSSINLSIGDNSENLTLASDWDSWSSQVTVRIGDVGFSGAVWDLYTFTRLITSSEATKYKAGYRISNYAFHNSLRVKDGKISNGYVSGFVEL